MFTPFTSTTFMLVVLHCSYFITLATLSLCFTLCSSRFSIHLSCCAAFKSADDLRFLHSIKSVGGVVGSANSRAYSLIQRPCSVHTAKKGEICPYSWGRDAICLESQCLKNGQLSIVFKVRANKMDKSINASRINAAANLTRSSIIKCPSGKALVRGLHTLHLL